jgi:DNA modification methylase
MTATILQGDVLTVLRTLPSDHFGCIITSPPYWGLRDYGSAGQIGLEPTLGEHLAVMVEVMEECRRVLHPAGTCWVNYGDCYATTPNGRSAEATKAAATDDRTYRDKPFSTVGPIYAPNAEGRSRRGGTGNLGNHGGDNAGRIYGGGVLKPKDLCLLPARLAIAMQEAGWWVRCDITWAKPNPMPDSSARYRPGMASERIFMFAKSDQSDFYVARDTGEVRVAPDLSENCPLITKPDQMANRCIRLGHYYDAQAVMQGRSTTSDGKMPDGWGIDTGAHGTIHRKGRIKGSKLTGKDHGRHTLGDAIPEKERRDKQRGHYRRHAGFNDRWDAMTRDEQTEGGRYLRSWEPAPQQVWEIATKPFRESHFATFPPELVERCIRAGCAPGMPILDPFGGSGTTALVADAYGFDSTLIELNPDYCALARRRLAAGLVRMDRPATPDGPKDPGSDARQGVLW